MNERVPTYLANHVFNVTRDDYLNVQVRSGAGGEYFEIYYFGELFHDDLPNDYIADFYDDEDELVPCKLVAKCVKTGEEILLFDGAAHGYNAMFCDELDAEKVARRELVKFNLPPRKIHLKFGYSIDYDDEMDEYETDERGKVLLINGGAASWDEVKANGFDYIAVSCEDEAGEITEILSLELA